MNNVIFGDCIDIIQHKANLLDDYPDEYIAEILESIIYNGFYNFSIVSEEDLEKEKNSEYGGRYFDNVYSLPETNDAW
jgi:hypothetical protein